MPTNYVCVHVHICIQVFVSIRARTHTHTFFSFYDFLSISFLFLFKHPLLSPLYTMTRASDVIVFHSSRCLGKRFIKRVASPGVTEGDDGERQKPLKTTCITGFNYEIVFHQPFIAFENDHLIQRKLLTRNDARFPFVYFLRRYFTAINNQ